MASALDGLRKSLNKKYEKLGYNIEKKPVAQLGLGVDKFKQFFSFGTPSLDFITYNFIPRGIMIEITGDEGSGKTTLCYKIASDFIRQEKLKPEEERQHILYIDAETTADSSWAMTSSGYDMNDKDVETLYLQGTGQTAEQFFDDVRDAVATGRIGLVIFDSFTAIAPQLVANETMEKKDMGALAKCIGDFVKRCTGLFNRYGCTFVAVNGTILNISGYGNPETTPGGKYWRRACSLRIKCKRGEYFDENGDKLSGSAESPAGHVIEVALLKTKFCRWDRKLGRTHLNYEKGIDVLWDTISVATMYELIKVDGRTYTFINPDTNELLCDENNKPYKVVGEKNVKSFLTEHLDLWKKMYDIVYQKLSVKDDPNCVSFEKMLGIDVNKEFNMDLDKEDVVAPTESNEEVNEE